MNKPAAINDVSDTAIWVAAHYRAKETERPDAMFRDPLAKLLVGERGAHRELAGAMGRYTEWIVLTRTVNIDDFILDGIRGGVDAVLSTGRGHGYPALPHGPAGHPQWVEADFPI